MATNETPELLSYAVREIATLFREGDRYQKAGMILTQLVPETQIQGNLWDERDRDRARKLMQTLDQINTQMGAGTLKFAAEGLEATWKGKAAKRSPRFSICWEELPVVQAR